MSPGPPFPVHLRTSLSSSDTSSSRTYSLPSRPSDGPLRVGPITLGSLSSSDILGSFSVVSLLSHPTSHDSPLFRSSFGFKKGRVPSESLVDLNFEWAPTVPESTYVPPAAGTSRFLKFLYVPTSYMVRPNSPRPLGQWVVSHPPPVPECPQRFVLHRPSRDDSTSTLGCPHSPRDPRRGDPFCLSSLEPRLLRPFVPALPQTTTLVNPLFTLWNLHRVPPSFRTHLRLPYSPSLFLPSVTVTPKTTTSLTPVSSFFTLGPSSVGPPATAQTPPTPHIFDLILKHHSPILPTQIPYRSTTVVVGPSRRRSVGQVLTRSREDSDPF